MAKKRKKKKVKNHLIPTLIIVISLFITIICKNNIFGFIILVFGLLNGWYAGLGKWYNYFFGAIFSLLNSYVSFKAHLYGIAWLSALLYFPLQIQGLLDWHKQKDKNNNITIKSFNTKISVLMTICCFAGSISLGFLLAKIPNQNLAFLDATSNAINICAIILLNLRFRESWWILLGNNIADLAIWIINTINNTPNSMVMLIVSIGHLILNIFGLVKWEKNKKAKGKLKN